MIEPTSPGPSREGAWAESKRKRKVAAQDLVSTIEQLANIAERALGEGSLAGWNAARAALAAAGRLQMGVRAATGAGAYRARGRA